MHLLEPIVSIPQVWIRSLTFYCWCFYIFKAMLIHSHLIFVPLSSCWSCAEVLWLHYLCKLWLQPLHLSTGELLQWQQDKISSLRIMRWITCMAALANLHGFNYLSTGSFSSHFSSFYPDWAVSTLTGCLVKNVDVSAAEFSPACKVNYHSEGAISHP